MSAVALLFTGLVVDMMRRGSASAWIGDKAVLRTDDPTMFWFWWSGWFTAAGFWWFMAGRWLLDWHAAPDPDPADWTLWVMASVPLLGLLLVVRSGLRSHRIWSQGNPWRATTRARLRRLAALRELIRDLADDPSTGWDDMTLDDLVDMGDFSYLDAVAAHLLTQPQPRRLALAIDALREEKLPMDPDDRAYLVESGIDPDADSEPEVDAGDGSPR